MKSDKKYINNQVEWLHKWSKAKFEAISEAVKIVDKTSAANNEKQNEWRGQLKDQAGTFATKEQLEAIAVGFERRVKDLEDKEVARNGKIWAIGITWVVITFLLFYFKK